MPSAALPPELHQIARDAARNGRRPAPPRTATILGLGHYLPTEIVPNGHIAERIGVDDHWIVKRTGIHARRRAAANEGTTDLAVFAARRALQDAGTDAARSRLRDRRDDERGRDHARTARRASPTRSAPSAPPRSTSAPPAPASSPGSRWPSAMIEVGRAERILLIGAEKLTRITDFDDKKTGMLFGDGAGAVVLGPSESGRRHRPDRPDRRRRPGRHDHGHARGPVHPHGRHLDVQDRHQAPVGVDDLRRPAPPASSSTTSTSSSTTRPTRGSSRRSASGSTSSPPRSPTTSRSSATRRAASIPLTLSLSREDGRLRPGHKVLVAAIGAGFTWGAGVMEWTGS